MSSEMKSIKNIRAIKPQRRNANRHSQRGMGQLERSVQSDGWIGAITVAADGETFDGSARVEVASAVGFDDVIVVESDGTRPIVHVRTDIPTADDPRAARLGIAANRIAQTNLEWDTEVLAALAEDGVDLAAFWQDDELDELLGSLANDAPKDDPGAQVDRAEELREKWSCSVGQVWELGEHRLVVGNCTDAEVIAGLMQGDRPRLGLHDPPYGIAILSTGVGDGEQYGGMLTRRNHFAALAGDEAPFDPTHLVGSADLLVIWGANHFADKLPASAAWIVWDKRVDLPSNDFSDGEMAWVSAGGSVRIIRHTWNGLIRDSERGEQRLHPTQKPVEVLAEIIDRYTETGDIVADWYLGSGSTLIACEQTGRRCRGAEVEPKYAAVAIQRWSDATGREPVCVSGR